MKRNVSSNDEVSSELVLWRVSEWIENMEKISPVENKVNNVHPAKVKVNESHHVTNLNQKDLTFKRLKMEKISPSEK